MNIYDKKYDRVSKVLIQTYDKEIIEHLLNVQIKSIIPVDREINLPEKHMDSTFHINNEYIINIEFQTEYDENIEQRLLLYRCLLKYKYNKPVKSVIIYLKESSNIKYEYSEDNQINFKFDVVKIWELDLDRILEEKILCLAPFIPIIKKDQELIKSAYNIIIESEAENEAKENLLNCMLVFSTLMYSKEIINKMIAPIEQFKKTEFFQELAHDLVEQSKIEGEKIGIIKGEKDLLLRLLTKKFKKIPENLESEINKIGNIQTIEKIVESIFEIQTPEDIFKFIQS